MTQNRPSWLHRARRDRPSPGTLCPVVTSQGHRDFLHSLFLSASSAFLLRRPGDQFPGGGASFPTYHPICATRHRLGLGLSPPPSTLSRATVVLSFGGCSVLQRSSSCNNKALGSWSLSIASLATSPGWELETGFEQTGWAGEVGARIRTPPAPPHTHFLQCVHGASGLGLSPLLPHASLLMKGREGPWLPAPPFAPSL